MRSDDRYRKYRMNGEVKLQEEFRRKSGWSFDPTEFGFRIAKRWNKSITDPAFDKSDYYYEAEHRIRDRVHAGVIYTCLIHKCYGKEFRFTVREQNDWRDEGCEGTLISSTEYNIPNIEVAKIVLAGLPPVGRWYEEDSNK